MVWWWWLCQFSRFSSTSNHHGTIQQQQQQQQKQTSRAIIGNFVEYTHKTAAAVATTMLMGKMMFCRP